MGCANSSPRAAAAPEPAAASPRSSRHESTANVTDHAAADWLRGPESIADTAKEEPSEAEKSLQIKWRVVKANLMYDINPDPEQFVPADEMPRGQKLAQLMRSIHAWMRDCARAATAPDTPTGSEEGASTQRAALFDVMDSVSEMSMPLTPHRGMAVSMYAPSAFGSSLNHDPRSPGLAPGKTPTLLPLSPIGAPLGATAATPPRPRASPMMASVTSLDEPLIHFPPLPVLPPSAGATAIGDDDLSPTPADAPSKLGPSTAAGTPMAMSRNVELPTKHPHAPPDATPDARPDSAGPKAGGSSRPPGELSSWSGDHAAAAAADE